MKNWTAGSSVEAKIKANSHLLKDTQLRRFLLAYLQYYQSIYAFDILDYPYSYLEKKINGETSNIDLFREKAVEHIEYGLYEYCISLNEISEAANILIDSGKITAERLLKGLNHVLEAFSCNEEPSDFLNREIDNIYKHWVDCTVEK